MTKQMSYLRAVMSLSVGRGRDECSSLGGRIPPSIRWKVGCGDPALQIQPFKAWGACSLMDYTFPAGYFGYVEVATGLRACGSGKFGRQGRLPLRTP